MKKRILALILSALMVVPMIACSGDVDTNKPTETTAAPSAPTSTTAPDETTAAPETELTPDLPEVRYDNTGNPQDAELSFIKRFNLTGSYKEPWLMADGYNGEILNDAIFDRNTYVQEKYGVKFVYHEIGEPSALLQKASLAQDDIYDVMFDSFIATGSMAKAGNLYNIIDFGHVNYDMPWWDSNSVEGMTYNGQLYGVVSDISLSALSCLRGMIFNRDMIRLYNLEDPYQLVKDNKWTLDKLITMVGQVSADLDGDQQWTDADRYGMLVESGDNDNAYYMAIAAGCKLFELNGTDITASFLTDEKVVDILTRWSAVIADKTTTRNYGDQTPDSSGQWTFGRKQFAADHYLFINAAPHQFDVLNNNNMVSEYGIVPNPKYTENQDRYYHALDRYTSCLSIPATNAEEDIERISILLEDLAYKSSKTLIPAYYENVIALRRARVPELGEMVAIMKNSVYYDVSTLYTIDYPMVLTEAMASGNIASSFKKYEKIVYNGITQIQKKLGETK